LRKHGIAWIMGGVEGDIQGGAAGNPIKGEGEPFRSLCAQVKLSDLVVVITALSRFFLYIYTGGEASVGRGSLVFRNVGSIPTYRLPSYLLTCVPHLKSHGSHLVASCIPQARHSLRHATCIHSHGLKLSGMTLRFPGFVEAWSLFLIASFLRSACKSSLHVVILPCS